MVIDAPTAPEWEPAEKLVGYVLGVWDRAIQDDLSGQCPEAIAAYSLGRGLAEVYWGLIVGESTYGGLDFLLGAERVALLQGLLLRLGKVLPALTIRAIGASLDQWKAWVGKSKPLNDAAIQALADQNQIWQALLIESVDPITLVSADLEVQKARNLLPIAKAYAAQAGIALLGLALLTVAASQIQNASHALPTVLAFLGVSGVSVSAIQVRAKNVSHGLTERLRNRLHLELVEAGATRLPR